jgi:hypothetical protein
VRVPLLLWRCGRQLERMRALPREAVATFPAAPLANVIVEALHTAAAVKPIPDVTRPECHRMKVDEGLTAVCTSDFWCPVAH